MVGTSAVQDVLDLLVLALSPGLVAGTTVLDETSPDSDKADGDDGLLVHDVVLVGQSVDGKTGGRGQDGALAQQAVAGKGVNDALCLLLGLLGRDIARVADRGGRDSGKNSAGDGRSEEGSACFAAALVHGSAPLTPSQSFDSVIRRTDSAARQAGGHCG